MSDRVAALLARQDCAELVYKMARGIDRMDESLLRSLFWEDATDDHGLFSGTAAAFVAWVLPVLGSMRSTSHNITNVLIAVDDDRAAGESYFIAQHSLDGDPPTEMFACGRYLDSFARRGDEWRFARRHAVYDWTMSVPASGAWDAEPMKGLLARGRRGRGDASYPHLAAIGP